MEAWIVAELGSVRWRKGAVLQGKPVAQRVVAAALAVAGQIIQRVDKVNKPADVIEKLLRHADLRVQRCKAGQKCRKGIRGSV